MAQNSREFRFVKSLSGFPDMGLLNEQIHHAIHMYQFEYFNRLEEHVRQQVKRAAANGADGVTLTLDFKSKVEEIA